MNESVFAYKLGTLGALAGAWAADNEDYAWFVRIRICIFLSTANSHFSSFFPKLYY